MHLIWEVDVAESVAVTASETFNDQQGNELSQQAAQ